VHNTYNHLDGNGYWTPESPLTFKNYVKWRIHHRDPRWVSSLKWVTWALDYYEKKTIHGDAIYLAKMIQATTSDESVCAFRWGNPLQWRIS